VDFLKGIEVCDTDLRGRKAYNGAILLVKGIDVENSLTSNNSTLETEMCEACIPRSRKVSRGTSKANIDELKT
jgi:hypothetical protein